MLKCFSFSRKGNVGLDFHLLEIYGAWRVTSQFCSSSWSHISLFDIFNGFLMHKLPLHFRLHHIIHGTPPHFYSQLLRIWGSLRRASSRQETHSQCGSLTILYYMSLDLYLTQQWCDVIFQKSKQTQHHQVPADERVCSLPLQQGQHRVISGELIYMSMYIRVPQI